MYTCLYTKGNKKVTPLLCEKLSLDKGKYKRNLQKASSQIEKKTLLSRVTGLLHRVMEEQPPTPPVFLQEERCALCHSVLTLANKGTDSSHSTMITMTAGKSQGGHLSLVNRSHNMQLIFELSVLQCLTSTATQISHLITKCWSDVGTVTEVYLNRNTTKGTSNGIFAQAKWNVYQNCCIMHKLITKLVLLLLAT